MNNLVIVESPNKIKSLKKYLGKDYQILATVGHIVRLPASGKHQFGIDLETWTPNYKIDPKKRKHFNKLKAALKNKKEIYIATDMDREGEAIGDNLIHFLKLKDNYKRIRFNEISEKAIKKAILNPTKINDHLVSSQIARRILDRIIGFKLSQLMKKKIKNTPIRPSAGRVQSIALKKVVEREEEISIFVPVKYVTVNALIDDQIEAILISGNYLNHKEWIDPKDIEKVKKDFKGFLRVETVKKIVRKDKKKTPLKQATLYKKGVSTFGMSSRAIQSAAQRLYEGYGDGGLISYPRTDSTRLSDTFIEKAKAFIIKKYTEEYFNDKIKGFDDTQKTNETIKPTNLKLTPAETKEKNNEEQKYIQDAHEAIRPIDFKLTPAKAKEKFNLSSGEEKIYTLIYEHTLMCLMMPPIRENFIYHLKEGMNKFRISFSKIVFDGYLKVSGYQENNDFPTYEKEQIIPVKDYIVKNAQTLPPPRYNDGSLIETLDNIGVGRPSTFASTINILKDRLYIDLENKAFKLTKFGKIVYEKLTEGFPNIINEEYTSNMEKQLDQVAEGLVDYKDILNGFWSPFEKDLENAAEIISLTELELILANKDCAKCKEPMIVRINKKDKTKFFGCSKFPECKYTESDPSQKSKRFKNNYFKSKPKDVKEKEDADLKNEDIKTKNN